MKTTLITSALFAFVIGASGSAFAAKPVEVDCERLKTAIAGVDFFLDTQTNISFGSLGDLVATAILDPATGGTLVGLVNAFYGEAVFSEAKEILSTTAKCGNVPALIDEIRDPIEP